MNFIVRELIGSAGGAGNAKHDNASEMDHVLFQVRDYRNRENLANYETFSGILIGILDTINFKSNMDRADSLFFDAIHKYKSIVDYGKLLCEDDVDAHECVIFDLFEYCSNKKRPHLGIVFYRVVHSCVAGDLIVNEAVEKFVIAMLSSDEVGEREVGEKMLSKSA